MLSKEEKKRILNLWGAGFSSGEIAEDVVNARFFELFRNTRNDVEAYITERKQ